VAEAEEGAVLKMVAAGQIGTKASVKSVALDHAKNRVTSAALNLSSSVLDE